MRLIKVSLILFSSSLMTFSFPHCWECDAIPNSVLVNSGSPPPTVPGQIGQPQIGPPQRPPIFQPVLPPIIEELVNIF